MADIAIRNAAERFQARDSAHVQIGDRHTTHNNCKHKVTAANTYKQEFRLTCAFVTYNIPGRIGPGHIRLADNECLRTLRLTDPRDDKQEILARKDPLLKDSCRWVCNDPAFLQWWDDDESRILWIHGDPGKGKTMIMMALVDELSDRLKKASQSLALSYFFCQSTNGSTNTATSILRGLIYMLVKDQPQLLEHLQKKYDDAGPGLFEGTSTLYSLWSILSDMVNDPRFDTVYLMIDALDECNVELVPILDLLTRKDLSATRKVKWLLTSRNESRIRKKLEGGDDRQHTSLEVNAAHVSGAVQAFIDFKVAELAQQNEYDEQVGDFVKGYLKDNAQETFLWVALVCKQLSEAWPWEIEALLRSIPAGLAPFYDRMMKQVTELSGKTHSYCLRVLKAATVASRPLQLEELKFVADLPEGPALKAKAVQQLIGLCGSFLTLREDVVFFVHQSAKDYCDTGAGSRVLGQGARSWQTDLHDVLARRSLGLMSLKLKQDICNLRLPGFLAIDVGRDVIVKHIAVDLRYACSSWIHHLLEGGERSTEHMNFGEGGPIDTFFRSHLLYWLETLSLTRELVTAVQGLVRLEADLQKYSSKAGSRLQAAVSDAKRFLLSFRVAIEAAPLQVYGSALLFSPTESVIRRRYGQLIPAWVEFQPEVDETWGAALHTLEGHSSYVRSVVFPQDGKLIASGSRDSTVRIWDTATGVSIHTLEGHSGEVKSVVFSQDGKLVASASDDRTVRIWDAATGVSIHTLEGHSDEIRSVVFSQDGKLVASASDDGTVRIWDAGTGVSIHTLEGHSGFVRWVVFSQDGKLVASGSIDSTVRIWDAATGVSLHTLEGHSNWVSSGAFSHDGKLVASGSWDSTVRIWDTITGVSLHILTGHSGWVTSVIFSPHGKLVASGSRDSTVRIWDTATGVSLYTLEGHSSYVSSMAFSSDGKLVASASGDRTIRIWDAVTGVSLHTLEGHSDCVNSVVFMQDGKLVASASDDRTIRIWDTATDVSHHTLEGHSDEVRSVVFSQDGKLVASGSDDRTVRIWDAATGNSLYTLEGHSNWVRLVVFSQDGKLVASASDDRTVRIWDAGTGVSIHTLEGHSDEIRSVVFSQDGKLVASGSIDRTVRVWELGAGACVHLIEDVRVFDKSTLLDVVRSWQSSTHENGFTTTPFYHESRFEDSVITIDKTNQWIKIGTQKILWIPANVRPGVFGLKAGAVMIGSGSGRMTLIRLNRHLLPRQSTI